MINVSLKSLCNIQTWILTKQNKNEHHGLVLKILFHGLCSVYKGIVSLKNNVIILYKATF